MCLGLGPMCGDVNVQGSRELVECVGAMSLLVECVASVEFAWKACSGIWKWLSFRPF